MTVTISTDVPFGELTLTGPTGTNAVHLRATVKDSHGEPGICEYQAPKDCGADQGARRHGGRPEPEARAGAGRLVAPGTAGIPTDETTDLTYYPDDPAGVVVTITMQEQFKEISWIATPPTQYPGQKWPPPATYEPFTDRPLLSMTSSSRSRRPPGSSTCEDRQRRWSVAFRWAAALVPQPRRLTRRGQADHRVHAR